MNKAILRLSPELLCKELNIPPCEVYGCEWDFNMGCIKLYIKSFDTPKVADGDPLPEVMVEYTQTNKFVW